MNTDKLQVFYFWFCAILSIAGALVTVLAENPIRSGLGLLLTIGGIAALFLSLSAEFLAATQLIVYAGAVVVLFLFVIMLIGPDAQPPKDNKGIVPRTIGALLMALTTVFGIVAILAWDGSGKVWGFPKLRGGEGTIESIANEVFVTGIVPFELSSALLIVAVVGAIAVARGKQGVPGLTSRERAIQTSAAAKHAAHGRETSS
jgi:NADH-quinone oxidoreductase subunit J